MEPVYWLIAIAVFLVLESITLGLSTIWFAGGALAGFIACMAGAPQWVQFLLFFTISIILLIFTRPIAEKYLNKSRTKTNVDSLIGKTGKVLEVIDNKNETGRIMLQGMEWTARSENDDIMIPKEDMVVICEVKGAHVIVKRA